MTLTADTASTPVAFKGFLLLMAGIPVHVWMRWQNAREPMLVPGPDGEPLADTPDLLDLTVSDGG